MGFQPPQFIESKFFGVFCVFMQIKIIQTSLIKVLFFMLML